MNRSRTVLRVVAIGVILVSLLQVAPAHLPGFSDTGRLQPSAAADATSPGWTNISQNVSDLPEDVNSGSIMAYDATENYTILFSANGNSADTSAFYAGKWTNLTAAGGPILTGSVMAYDPVIDGGGVVLFDSAGATWFFQAGSWSQLTTSGTGPPGQSRDLMAYDAADQLLLISNQTQVPVIGTAEPTGMWALAPNLTWSTVAALPVDVDDAETGNFIWPQMTYDAHDGYLLAINDGGWTYAFSNGTWTNLSVNDIVPAAYFNVENTIILFENLVYDPGINATVLFGGECEIGQYGGGGGCGLPQPQPIDQTWTFSEGNWTQLAGASSDSPDALVAAAYDSAAGYLVAYGVSPTDLTWAFTVGSPTAYLHPTVLASPNPTDEGVPVNLTASFAPSAWSFSYSWSNGALSSDTNESWSVQGVYLVTLTISDPLGSYLTDSINVTVNGPPIAVATFPDRQTAGIPEPFHGNSTNGTGTRSYRWSFGDGTGAAVASGTHSYLTPGVYNVSLNVTDSVGVQGSYREQVVVAPGIRLSLTASNDTPVFGEAVLFTANASGGLGGFQYAWSGLPPGCVSIDSPELGCIPSEAGDYMIVVNATDGYLGFANSTIFVEVKFVAAATSSSTVLYLGQAVTFEVQSAAPNLTYSYTGLPPGCLPQNVSELVCTPTSTGNFTVDVTVTTHSGNSTSFTFRLEVLPAKSSGSQGSNSSMSGSGGPSTWLTFAFGLGVGSGVAGVGAAIGVIVYIRARRPPG